MSDGWDMIMGDGYQSILGWRSRSTAPSSMTAKLLMSVVSVSVEGPTRNNISDMQVMCWKYAVRVLNSRVKIYTSKECIFFVYALCLICESCRLVLDI